MRVSSNFALLLFALLVLVPGRGWASMTKNCPTEPAQNVPIVSGETYWGTNCVLNTTGDLDSFTFTASAGDTWGVVAGLGTVLSDICMSLFVPGSTTPIFSRCTAAGSGTGAVATNQNLKVAGTYTIVITELVNANGQTYGLSLERLSPTPPDAIALVLSKNVTGEVNPPTAQDAYSFFGATTGSYQIAASYTGGIDLCFNVYRPNGTSALSGSAPCTAAGSGTGTIKTDFTPTQNATYLVVVYSINNDGTSNYNLELSCLPGFTCKTQQPPPCTLSDAASYSATTSTLTMKFTIGNNLGTTAIWNAWLTYADPQATDPDTMQLLFSKLQPITNPPKVITVPFGLPKEGTVGVLSTLSTSKNGIACSSWVRVATGTDPLSP